MTTSNPTRPMVVCLIAILWCGTIAAKDVLPDLSSWRAILEQRCLSCHNSVDRKGDFALQTREELQDSGMIEPGDVDASHLLSVLLPDGDKPPQMPRDDRPLSQAEIDVLREWIRQGAPWPQGLVLAEPFVDDFDWWSLQPLTRPENPRAATSGGVADDWPRTPIDQFILKELIEHGLTPSPEADRRTLIRRLTFDLIGLPPTPEEVEAFANDRDPLAWEQLVDRLLASPQYGERWGRHWLDVVKYADTCGYDKDKLRPNAWPYRDYVVRSFNQDKPYARFVREQIAGDVLYPGEPDGIIGLGFLAAGPWDFIGHVEVPESKIDGKVARNLDRDEMVSNTFNTFCSVTVQCARCHNHKFDPITQKDYYDLQAVFAAVDRAERPYDLDPHVEERRRTLTVGLSEAQEELENLQQTIRKEGGEQLAEIERQLTELRPLVQPDDKRPEFGYHSAIETSADVRKWVQIDLGRVLEISRIVLHPSHDDFDGIGAGFGFPLRFRIESSIGPDAFSGRSDSTQASIGTVEQTSSGPQNRSVTGTHLLIDHAADVPNTGLTPYQFECNVKARFIRVTATRLAERKNDYIFALAELVVHDRDGQVVSTGAHVTALDSIEAPVRWGKQNLTDGIWPRPADEQAAVRYSELRRRHTVLTGRLRTPQRQEQQAKLEATITSTSDALEQLPQGRMVYAAATDFEPQGQFKPTRGIPRPVAVLHRGDVRRPGEPARPGAIRLTAASSSQFDLDPRHSEADRRAALAEWLTQPANPLVWRSIVNRIWQYHFGEGLVSTPNDFGRMGQPPTHPELLDWLAMEFRVNGGEFKQLHRLIVTSAVYRQSSAHRDRAAEIDSGNRLLWRMNRRRLSAEEIRDSILTVSGRLNPQMSGPGYHLFEIEKPEHSPHYEYLKHDPDDPASHRRAVYRFVVRSQPDPWMTILDCADSSQSTPRRDETLTSLQALSLLNNRFNLAMSEHFAARMAGASDDPHQQVLRAFSLVTGRSPDPGEQQQMTSYVRAHGLENLCRLLFNLTEFVFVD
jgi:hypothetical protein